MSSRPYFFFAAFLTWATAVHAVRPAPAAPAPAADAATPQAPKPTEPVPPYVLKNRSTFPNVTDTSRAPFWPIGWVKHAKGGPAQAPVEEAPKFTLDAKSFKLTSILVGSGTTASLAVINGRAYGEGEFIRMPKTAGAASSTSAPSAPPIRIRVQRIAVGGVTLQSGTQTVVVPLTHPELGARKPEELLDDKDR